MSIIKSLAKIRSLTKRALEIDPIAFVPNADIYDLDRAPYLWNVDNIVVGRHTNIWGWCLPHGGRLDNTQIIINGRSFNPVRTSPKGAYAELYPWHPNAALAAFTLQISHQVFDVRKEREISISCLSKSDRGEDAGYTLDLLVEDLDYVMPPHDVAARIGVTHLLHYVMFGRAIYRGFDKALKKNFGRSFSEYSTIVDWGCGSARVARHVAKALKKDANLVGFDIDAVAIEWANKNIGPYFRLCKTSPPLEQATATVDIVYAYSVLTHLAAETLATWLEEMARILKPGGIGLFTVLSDRAMIALQAGLARPALEAWRSIGILDTMSNSGIRALDVPGDYYRNVWLTRDYMSKIFSKQFEIVDFIGSFHFYQDLVVVRRR
jgi:SAM-dependent methyltransferase